MIKFVFCLEVNEIWEMGLGIFVDFVSRVLEFVLFEMKVVSFMCKNW